MSDVADDALDPVISTPGDVEREPDLPPTVAEVPPRKKGKDRKIKAEKAPRSKASLAQSKSKEIKQIRASLEGILGAPAMVINEPWPKAHVEAQAPNLANALCKKAEVDDEFRAKLLALLSAGDGAGLVLAGFMYIAPLALYYGAPAPPGAKKLLQIPARPGRLSQEDLEAIEPLPQQPVQDIVAEAAEHGFDDPEKYKKAVRKKVEEMHGHGAVLPDEGV